MKRLSIILTICITAINMLISCNDDGFEYSDYHCNLTIDNSTHLDATLASAMNAMTPGTVSYTHLTLPTICSV